ncbi:hypothetical protein ACHAXT_007259 [Thalassiosira profunda]
MSTYRGLYVSRIAGAPATQNPTTKHKHVASPATPTPTSPTPPKARCGDRNLAEQAIPSISFNKMAATEGNKPRVRRQNTGASGAGGANKKQSARGTGGGNNRGGQNEQRKRAVGGQGAPGMDPTQKRQNRKAGRRLKQLESMERKARAEDEHFHRCQREAAVQRRQPRKPLSKAQQKAQEDALMPRLRWTSSRARWPKAATRARTRRRTASLVFDDFGALALPAHMRKNVQRMHYTKSTPIQRHAIPLGLAGHDLMCCAQTGSGKTCAFLLPVCASLAAQNAKDGGKKSDTDGELGPVEPRCIVMAPTRELASQIELEAEKLCFNDPKLQPVAVYGGASQNKQLRELAFAGDGAIIVATPGRLTDFVDRNLISLRSVQYLILDEADRMLDMGFEPQIRKLVLRSGMTPKAKRQTAMFSATFPDQIQILASEFLRPSYTWIAVGRVGSTTESITQVIKEATPDKRHKLKLVVEAVQEGPAGRTLIFVQKKKTATWLKKQLSKGGPDGWEFRFDPIEAVEIHGDRSQSQREAALAKFRSGECRILVATDVAARGLDIGGVEHVINMDLPTAAEEFDSYTHRIGRTGRAGHTGLATSLYVPGDAPKVGNRKIAVKLIQQLREAKQEVPAFLEAECANAGGGAKQQRFGGTDVRSGRGGRGNSGRGNGGRGGGGRGGRGRRV